jgi:hypothetical protein
MDDLQLHRWRWWAKKLKKQGIGERTILNAIATGDLGTVRLSDAPNAPIMLHEGLIRDWYARRTKGGR